MLEPSDTKRRIVDYLKRTDNVQASELAKAFGLTATAIRQHLEALELAQLVARNNGPRDGKRGRPSIHWELTDLASELFPDRHGDLTVELITSLRESLGQEGLDKVIAARSKHLLDGYAVELDGTPVEIRVSKLAELRAAEGYMAESASRSDGAFTLTENHCPICDAAAVCQGLCADELDVFRQLFDDVATVERVSHLLSGDKRCVYEIIPRATPTEQ